MAAELIRYGEREDTQVTSNPTRLLFLLPLLIDDKSDNDNGFPTKFWKVRQSIYNNIYMDIHKAMKKNIHNILSEVKIFR